MIVLGIIALLVGSGATLRAQEASHAAGHVFGAPFQGDTWVVTADPVAYECCASYRIANKLIVEAWGAVRASLDRRDPDEEAVTTHSQAAALRQKLEPEDVLRYRRRVAGLQSARRSWFLRLAMLTESVYGTTSRERGVVLESVAPGEPPTGDRERPSFAPRYPDHLRPWIHLGASRIESPTRPANEASAMLAALFGFVRLGGGGDMPSLRRSMWGCLDALASTGDQFDATLRSVRIQNALGLSLLVRAVERESLIDGSLWGSGFRGKGATQRVRVLVRPEEIKAIEVFLVAGRKFQGLLSAVVAEDGVSKAEVELMRIAGKEFTLAMASVDSSLDVLRKLGARCAEAGGGGILELVEGDDLLRSLSAWRVEPLGAEGRDLDFMISGSEVGVADLDELNADARRVWVVQAAGGVRVQTPLGRCRLFLVPLGFQGGPEGPLLWR